MRYTLGSHPADHISAHGQLRMPRLVFLVGFMGAGKSTVGGLWHFSWAGNSRIWMNASWPGSSVPWKIFRDSGETEFRRAEHAALRALLVGVPCIAPGSRIGRRSLCSSGERKSACASRRAMPSFLTLRWKCFSGVVSRSSRWNVRCGAVRKNLRKLYRPVAHTI